MVAGLCVAALCVRLGFWQLDRLQQRRERNTVTQRALSLPVLHLRDSLPELFRHPDRYAYRRARAEGAYDSTTELVLRGRAFRGSPGVNLLTVLRVAPDTALLVNRGWVPSGDAATIDPRAYAEPGPRSVEGVLIVPPPRAGPVAPLTIRVGGTSLVSVARISLDSLEGVGAYALPPIYLPQLPTRAGEDALPRRLPLPETGSGPHLGYAIQWFSFAAIAVGGLALLLRRALAASRSGR